MTVNSSSIPALITAGKVRRRRRKRKRYASGGSPTNPALWDVPEEDLPAGSGLSPVTSAAGHIAKSVLWDLPHKAINAAKGTSYGLRREDFTDMPPDYSPDPNSPLGAAGIAVPKGAWQPTDDLIGASLEGATNVMGGTALSAPAKAAGEVIAGAGPVRGTRAARAKSAAGDVDGILAEEQRLARAAEQGYEGDWYHGGLRMDRFTESGKINPKRATSGPMPYFTDNPEMASSYAMGKKPDTSLTDNGRVSEYFTVDPKALGWANSRTPVEVERSWHFLSPEAKQDILNKAKRVGHQNIDEAEGPLVLHPEGVNATGAGEDHWNYIMQREAKGNPLAALRDLWHDSGRMVDDPGQLSEVFRLAGYPHPISEATAPWTEARGVFPAKLRMKNPLDTTNAEHLRDNVLPALEEAFKKDRSRKAQFGVDMWDKNHRYTPKEWVQQAKEDLAKGENSYVWTSIPDKVTEQLRRLGYDGILDTGGKGGGMGHTVAIPFEPDQVRSKFAKFDPKNAGSGKLLGAGATDKRAASLAAVDEILEAERGLAPAAEATPSIRAYHGSPHDFDKFDLSKIGTGEGAQAYGHGLYFAENEGVARGYRDTLAGDYFATPKGRLFDPQQELEHLNVRSRAHSNGSNLDATIALAEKLAASDSPAAAMAQRDLEKLLALKEEGGIKRHKGNMYEVEIAANQEHFLDWDKPLSQQPRVIEALHGRAAPEDVWADSYVQAVTKAGGSPAGVKEAVQDLVRNPGAASNDASWATLMKQPDVGMDLNAIHDELRPIYYDVRGADYRPKTGSDLYHGGHRTNGLGGYSAPVEASQRLREAGIPGIKYLDQGSRTAGEGSRNYVAFDDNMVKILRKYGIVGIPAAGVLGIGGEERRATGGSVNAALDVARAIKRKKGGRVHIGPIVGDTGGRADKVPMSVPDGSYVIPADIVSGLGEGNTGAGMVQLGKMFPKSKPRIMRESPGAVPILAADGEFVVSPDSILDRWDDLAYGHQALDAWVLHERQQLIETLEGLEPPAQD